MKRTRLILFDTLRKNRVALILFASMSILNCAIFYLYNMMTEALIYSEILIGALILLLLSIDFFIERKTAKRRISYMEEVSENRFTIPKDGNLSDKDYGKIIICLQEEMQTLKTKYTEQQQADDDYYTAWVHQIKTPIAVMKLELDEDTDRNRLLLSELFRIEQYVDMVLDYVRLQSNSNDLVIKEHKLDPIIREVLRKFAPQFILRKLSLHYEPSEETTVTDKKWLSFILEQLLSNAIKYTPAGDITVTLQKNKIAISDTGIGIAAEDLPRIFEKGYTGMNGRIGQKSSGLGLFLTKKAARLLNVKVQCESVISKGSTFTVIFPEKN